MSLGNIFKALAPIAAGAAFGPGGTLLAGSAGTAGSAVAAGALTGAGIAALSGDDPLMGAISGGMGGYGGSGIGEAMRGTAASAVTPTSSTLPSQFQNASGVATSSYGGAGIAPGNMNPTTLTSGFKASLDKPGQFLSNLGGGSMGKGAAKLGAVGLPAIGQAMVPEYNANPSDDPMSKYDPNRRLNVGMTTGIQNALKRDSGLRLNQFAQGGYLETGMGDGVSDDIPSSIDGEQPAALSENEFVIPADVVSGLGNGSSDAGAQQLYAMMDRVRKARTGTEKMGKEIKAERLMPA
tara:strand:- start:333 stop:1217 length:885 start_codon:yes stop_codon:yes gene_type:complete